ncbi:phosphate acyltransferase PlsX [Enhygromyxa salina]|uniref:Phosphate acyltransferase n=1 Tax=Enhygromyxa salina TaxID=215803 RepID=A0A2S9YPM2_9BACT|nr:phosphate acyltransferase PlsX [Enhygromyxa salina]PRQ07044.1 Phosphate acyltransferase [Enhygromyxa salina]
MAQGRKLRIGLDGFGSDRRPDPEIEAAVRAAKDGLGVELVGDRAVLDAKLAELAALPEGISVAHAPDQIEMDESPARAVRGKPRASLCVAIDRLAAGHVDAVVSAGNSGAILAAALLRLGRLPGVDRPAIATSFPSTSTPGGRTVLLDAGVNVQCKVLNLVQFAVIGAAFSRVETGVVRPRVGVLANGTEVAKGTALTQGTHELLSHDLARRSDAFEFIGYVEPGQLFGDSCDVAVTDGWTGNVLLKLAEAAMHAWPAMLRAALADPATSPRGVQGEHSIAAAIEPALQGVARRLDPESHGGAPLLGVDGAVMICHGAARPRAIQNALLGARRSAESGLTQAVASAIEGHAKLFELARNHR